MTSVRTKVISTSAPTPASVPQNQEYKAISLFSGCGGSSLGYHMAGYDILLANEFIDIAREVYSLNFPKTIVLQNDIRKISGSEILTRIGLRKGELDLLDGSPPCSSFSTAGRRQKLWGQTKLYSELIKQRTDDLHLEYERILKAIQPKVFVCENVAAIGQGLNKGFFNEIFRNTQNAGYNVKAAILDAANYKVPQHRRRMFFIGTRKDLPVSPSFPKPNNKLITFGEAIWGLKNEDWEIKEASTYHRAIAYYLRRLKPGQRGSDIHRKQSYYGLERTSFNRVCPTVTAIGTGLTNHKRNGLCHPLENRYLTISELKRISTFPDNFKLIGNFVQQWERIARAVPPLLMKAIAMHIKTNILDKT